MNRLLSLLCWLFFVAASAEADAKNVPEIVGYEKWLPVTEHPVSVTSELWTLCIAPPSGWDARNSGPHKGGYISVRVNDVGRKIFLNERLPRFPDGTVIVKEKLLTAADQKPESLGIMIKKKSNWEFAFVDSDGKVSRGREQLENCYSCHAKVPTTDGVFRTYLAQQQNFAWNLSAANKRLEGSATPEGN